MDHMAFRRGNCQSPEPRSGCGGEQIKQMAGERKVRNEIDPELRFEPVLRLARGGYHDASVVDQNIKAVVALGKPCSKSPHGRQGIEIHDARFERSLRRRRPVGRDPH